jgi:hypothetical protein
MQQKMCKVGQQQQLMSVRRSKPSLHANRRHWQLPMYQTAPHHRIHHCLTANT